MSRRKRVFEIINLSAAQINRAARRTAARATAGRAARGKGGRGGEGRRLNVVGWRGGAATESAGESKEARMGNRQPPGMRSSVGQCRRERGEGTGNGKKKGGKGALQQRREGNSAEGSSVPKQRLPDRSEGNGGHHRDERHRLTAKGSVGLGRLGGREGPLDSRCQPTHPWAARCSRPPPLRERSRASAGSGEGRNRASRGTRDKHRPRGKGSEQREVRTRRWDTG